MSDCHVKKIVTDFFTQLNDNDVEYCHWKSNEHLLEGLTGKTDLDILLNKKDVGKFEKIARDEGFLRFNSQYASRYPGVEDWIGEDHATGSLIHIHLHYRLATGHTGLKEYSLPWLEDVFKTRKQDEEYSVYICAPEEELVCLLSRIALKAKYCDLILSSFGRYKVSKDDQREIDYLRKHVNYDMVHEICNRSFSENTESFNIIYNGDLNGKNLFIFRNTIHSDLKKFRYISGFRYIVARWYYNIAMLIRLILRHKLGFCVITKKTVMRSQR